tara:strand:+ start:360 stop:1055 length:696 start_codon:yes stop_codon:yes gene_type:complete
MTQIFAHRGASRTFPENTLDAFEYAETLGAGWIELDVWLSEDGVLTVHHDEKLKSGESITENPFQSFPDSIPSLQDVLNSTTTLGINVEVKTPDSHTLDSQTRMLIDVLSRMLQEIGSSRDFLISSFNYKALSYFREQTPDTPIGFLIWEFDGDLDSLITKIINSNFQAIHPANTLVTKSFVTACSDKNVNVNVWTVNEEDRIRELVDFGVDGVITDIPDIALALVEGQSS